MLKTNSKKAKQNLQNYITENFDGTNYGIEKPDTFKELATIILDSFKDEYCFENNLKRMTRQQLFVEWCAGLPSILDTCYYYNRSAIDDLGTILEESEEERNRYTEAEAEQMLSNLIYRELVNA